MSLFAIGDLHLHFQSELKAPGQLREPVWKDHEEKLLRNCRQLVRPEAAIRSRSSFVLHLKYRRISSERAGAVKSSNLKGNGSSV